jgi:hypothetical protein
MAILLPLLRIALKSPLIPEIGDGILRVFSHAITDFGFKEGVTGILVLTAVAKLASGWRTEKDSIAVLGGAAGMMLINHSFSVSIINAVTVFLTAKIIPEIYQKKWQSILLKRITISILCLIILFSGISFMSRIFQDEGYSGVEGAAEFIKNNGEGMLLTDPLLNDLLKYYGVSQIYSRDMEEIAQNRMNRGFLGELLPEKGIREMLHRMDQEQIRYVLVYEDMDDEFWGNRKEGLLFLLKETGYYAERYATGKTALFERETLKDTEK